MTTAVGEVGMREMFCYGCEERFRLAPTDDLVCVHCSSEFCAEVDDENISDISSSEAPDANVGGGADPFGGDPLTAMFGMAPGGGPNPLFGLLEAFLPPGARHGASPGATAGGTGATPPAFTSPFAHLVHQYVASHLLCSASRGHPLDQNS
jgi:hypothetical protein